MTNKQKNAGWSNERRQKARQRILQNKPWEKSTGPKTPEGKARSRYNALKTGNHSVLLPHTRQLLKLNKEFLEFQTMFAHDLYFVAALLREREHLKDTRNKKQTDRQS